MENQLPLGRKTSYPGRYDATQLFAIPRSDARDAASIPEPLPFAGEDVWNAWELSWLGPHGRPAVTTAEIRVPADSPNLVESKSLKLYLNSFAMSRFDEPRKVRETIARDLSACTGAPVAVQLDIDATLATLNGGCIDALDVVCDRWQVDAALLKSDESRQVSESLHTHLLRSLCPVTGQPDLGSLEITYSGPKIDPASLLRYVVSFREHEDFHEACIERLFMDIVRRCGVHELSVSGRYQRRGGIDINPFRSNSGRVAGNPRLWRQ